MERDGDQYYVRLDTAISTHTLTWSVTVHAVRTFQHTPISTHTLTWSVTDLFDIDATSPAISTHTLTWSVTTSAPLLSAAG